MKRQRNIPALNEVIQQKYEYENHLQKLQRIQAIRKTRLSKKQAIDKTITIQHIKNQRHTNFINKLFQEQVRIKSQNKKLFDKLNKTSYLIDDKSKKQRLSASSLTLSVKKNKEKDINRENSRLYVKLNNSVPYVNTKKIQDDYQKIRKISDRMRKYDHSCELKAKKYLKSATISVDSSQASKRKIIGNNIQSGKLKLNLAQFYNKEQIIKNKIGKWTRKPSQIIHPNLNKKRSQLKQNKMYGFFNTQFQNPQYKSIVY